MAATGYLGIDAGTQGLSVVLTNDNLEVIGTGEGGYDMIPGLGEGCYEQHPADWESALRKAMENLKANVGDFEVLAIGISGQMHGEVLADENGSSLGPARLWCDARNEAEGDELTQLFGVKMPKRITSARWLWTIRNQPEKAQQAAHMTTPAGWLAFRLTGEWNLGIGDAAGMFPIDQETLSYDESLLSKFDALVNDDSVPSLKALLPAPLVAGQESGVLHSEGAALLGLPEGIPVAPAEGDQPAALAGSLIGDAGMVSCSFGTSVCANSVGDRSFVGVSQAVDHFCAPDGKPINMVWLRNGTTYMNCVVEMFGSVLEKGDNPFEKVMPAVLDSPADCGGIIALPFMDDEPGLGISQGGHALLHGLNRQNANAGNCVKAALLATIFNLRLGSEVLDQQGFPRTELVLSGGLTKTPELGQILADAMNTKVTLLASSEEGTAWGAALMAKFRHLKLNESDQSWSGFLNDQASNSSTEFLPIAENKEKYDRVYDAYNVLLRKLV